MTNYKRFYKVVDGITHRTTGQEPPDSSWSHGMGPISDEAEKRRFAGISAAHAGKPKSEIQRERMRIAKLDKPKPSSQKQAMSATHLANSIAVKELRASRPELGYYEALAIVVANKKMNKETK